MGVSPKLYARIVRFNHAFRLKETAPAFDWLGVALHAGYHDYQHLVKDLQQFAGATLPRRLAENTRAPENGWDWCEPTCGFCTTKTRAAGRVFVGLSHSS